MYFMNLFPHDFIGVWVLADRQLSLDFNVKGNYGRDRILCSAFKAPPYDLSGNDADGNATKDITIHFASDSNLSNYNTIVIDITTVAASTSAVTISEIVEALNTDDTFLTYFDAIAGYSAHTDSQSLSIRVTKNYRSQNFIFYIDKIGAEAVLNFNDKAGVSDIPEYFDRCTIANKGAFGNSTGDLIALDPSNAGGASAIDDDIIDNAGLDSSTIQEDWALLKGRSGLFMFTKTTVDGSNRITEEIIYQAGAVEGDFARKIEYTYTAANTNPDQITEIPHVLVTGDLVTP